VRDVPGQVEHVAPQVLGQHFPDRHIKRLANPRQPILNVSHRDSFQIAAVSVQVRSAQPGPT
jgi:hypothetical protein